jgi:moderate conductance mechanosensitive channel
MRFAPVPDPSVFTDPTLNSHGYLYDLLRKAGLSDFAARTGQFLLTKPLKIIVILFLAVLIARTGAGALRRAVLTLRLRAPMRAQSERGEQRARTIADAIASAWRFVVGVTCVLIVLDEVGVNLAPLLAGAGIAGLAIAFGAQSLIKDYLAGLFVLVEDQYGVGDVITVGPNSGTVEDLNLRVTRIRSADGTVWFIPNGDIRAVGNQSMEWSRAIVDVSIAYDNDLSSVLAAIGDEAQQLHGDPVFGVDVLEPAEVQGVQAMGVEGVTIRVIVKTAPRRQWAVARELRTRITDRMRKDGVRGPGRTVLVTSGTLETGTPPPPPPPEP